MNYLKSAATRPVKTTGAITLLGTGTCQLQTDRMASSVLIEYGNLRTVFDFGRGTTLRLTQLDVHQNDLAYIILSHFHPDHLSDLIPYLQAACWSHTDPRTSPLTIYGPQGLRQQMDRILTLFEHHVLTSPLFSLNLVELYNGTFTIGDFPFEFTHLPPHNNHGLSFTCNNQRYVFTGDSDFHQGEIAFLKNATIAVVDAGHISDEELVELAVASSVKMMICSHLYREINAKKLNHTAQSRGYTGNIIVGEDLMMFPLAGAADQK